MLPAPARPVHGVPALLSFFVPGLGQLVKGQVAKGVIVFVAMIVLVVSIVGVPIALIVWLWGVYDAYNA